MTRRPNPQPVSTRASAAAAALVLAMVAGACSSGDDGNAKRDDAGGWNPEQVIAADTQVGEADPSCTGETDGILRIGSLLPATGDLAILGPPMFAAADLAVADINAAGGVNGRPVEYLRGDEGTTNADATVASHLQAGVDVILGAASSGVSEDEMPKIVDACKIMFSPANTGAGFTVSDDDDLYFRTAPSDILQGRVLAQLALEDGVASAAILARNGTYGESLAYFTKGPLEANGIHVVREAFYDPEASEFSGDVDAIINANPDALFLIGYRESGRLLRTLRDRGFTPDVKRIYFTDGNTLNNIGADFAEPGALLGIRGTFPSAQVPPEFTTRLMELDPTLVDLVYGPEAYDAVVITALAAVAAGTDQSDAVAGKINGITREGQPCGSFAECRDLLAVGTDIDYNGPSGPQDFAQPGEPTVATIAIHSFGENNQIDTTTTQYRSVALTP
ncbi:MAG TPA: ABC transporter substrate-binding protein [Acidimicrobiales bacterium]|jgi:branched-chain amino acid transport system substrate-binding protein